MSNPQILYPSGYDSLVPFRLQPRMVPGYAVEARVHDNFSAAGVRERIVESIRGTLDWSMPVVFSSSQFPTDIPNWAAFFADALQGALFDYYPDPSVAGYSVMRLADKSWKPAYKAPWVYSFKMAMRQQCSAFNVIDGSGNPFRLAISDAGAVLDPIAIALPAAQIASTPLVILYDSVATTYYKVTATTSMGVTTFGVSALGGAAPLSNPIMASASGSLWTLGVASAALTVSATLPAPATVAGHQGASTTITWPVGGANTFMSAWPFTGQPYAELAAVRSDNALLDGEIDAVYTRTDSFFSGNMRASIGQDVLNWYLFHQYALGGGSFTFQSGPAASPATCLLESTGWRAEYEAPGIYKFPLRMRVMVAAT